MGARPHSAPRSYSSLCAVLCFRRRCPIQPTYLACFLVFVLFPPLESRYWIDAAPFAPSDPHARYAMAPNTEHSYLFGLAELVPNVAAWATSVFAGTVATNPGFTWEASRHAQAYQSTARRRTVLRCGCASPPPFYFYSFEWAPSFL